MDQISQTAAQSPTVAVDKPETYGRAIGATLALAAALIAVAFVMLPGSAVRPSADSQAATLTDGYLPGAIAAHAAAMAQNADALTDGWEARLITSSRTAPSPRDGWEAGLVGPTVGETITDGWEASLFR
jgi:hypothetical protein